MVLPKPKVTSILAGIPLLTIIIINLFPLFLRLIGILLKIKTSTQRETIFLEADQDFGQKQDSQRPFDDSQKYSTDFTELRKWKGIIGFFHPFCNAGGGGERVLWAAIAATQQEYPEAICAVYTGDHEIERHALVETVRDRFDIRMNESKLRFIYLSQRCWILPSTWPYLTLLGQALGSLILMVDAFSLLVPDILIDTMGLHFAVALGQRLFPHMPTAAYVHYPTISTDMLTSLDDTTGNKGIHSGRGSGLAGRTKKIYWRAFAWAYGWVGGQIDIVMCNSTWTRNHITQLWSREQRSLRPATTVYPPCPVEEFRTKIDVSPSSESIRTKEKIILYIGQFRPEKNHAMILRAFSKFYLPGSASALSAKLVLIGSVRANTSDERHVYALKLLAHELKIQDAVIWRPDASFADIQRYLAKASIGVNGMYSEHFGIGNVEGLAAGLIPVVHNSGGPKLDIVVPDEHGKSFGYHAENDEEYAQAFAKIAEMSESERLEMRYRARKSVDRFTEQAFAQKWIVQMDELVKMAGWGGS